MPLKRFVYLSSLSVFGAIREQQPYQEITETDQPCPNTAYGRSKLEAEQFLDSVASRLPFVVLRPTGVYGPREKDYFLMVKSISQHADFSVGFKRQDITFVYVADVVQAVFLALDHGGNGRNIFSAMVPCIRVQPSADLSARLWAVRGGFALQPPSGCCVS